MQRADDIVARARDFIKALVSTTHTKEPYIIAAMSEKGCFLLMMIIQIKQQIHFIISNCLTIAP